MKDRKLWKIFVIGPLLLLMLAYGGGYVSQFIRNYEVWQQAGGGPGDGTAPAFPSGQPLDCLGALFSFPYGLYGFFICVGALAVLCFLVMRMGAGEGGQVDRGRNFAYSEKGTYGTSGFMTPEEMKGVLELTPNARKTKGIILGQLEGKVVCVPESSRMNRNVAVYGASGSMKSRAYVRNTVFQCVRRGESLILTDPKSELYGSMAEYLRQNGYLVKIFNLVDPEHSDSWQCLAEIEGQDIMAQLLAEIVIGNSTGKSDTIWPQGEKALLKAMALYVNTAFGNGDDTMGMISELLSSCDNCALDELFRMLPPNHPAKIPYGVFQKAEPKLRSGIIVGLGLRMQVFQNKLIREITSHREIDLTLPGRRKCAYFCVFSDQDSTFEFLSSLFISFLFVKLVRYADQKGPGGQLPVPVHFLADELANVGSIADLTKKISTIRSRGLSISCIFQNIGQMQNRYPYNAWQEILGNCDVQLFLGCTDELTAEFVSSRTGVATIGVESHAKQLNTWRISDYTPEYRKTSSVGKRQVMTADEVLRLPIDQALVIIRGQKVLQVEKYDFTLHPEAKKLVPCRASNHIPEWTKKKVDKAARKPAKKKPVIQKPPAAKPEVPPPPEAPPEPAPRPPKPVEDKKQEVVQIDKSSILS